jgi:hypothetical protein
VEVVPSPQAAHNRLVVSGFIERWEEKSRDGTYADAAAALDAHDVRALWAGNNEWAPFYCPGCDACYCRDHWHAEMEFDEGFYDCTWGTCPRGHRRMIDD